MHHEDDFEEPNNDEFSVLYNQCTDEQRHAVDLVMMATSGVFIVQGGAGTGKTLFVNCLAAGLQCRHRKLLCVASSALAASLISNGKTAHSALSIPVPVMEDSYCRWDPLMRRQLRKVDFIVWDEMSMIHHAVADCVDYSLQDLHSNSMPFGGKVMVFVGDFKQLPPVVKKGKGEFATLRKCCWWASATKLQFTKNFRALNNQIFINELDAVGNGDVENVIVPAHSLCESEDEMVRRVFSSGVLNSDDCIILTLKVQDASNINDSVMNLIPGEFLEALATDALPVDSNIMPETVASLSIGGNI
jgi:ATP-dependent DNA helicase PIF1